MLRFGYYSCCHHAVIVSNAATKLASTCITIVGLLLVLWAFGMTIDILSIRYSYMIGPYSLLGIATIIVTTVIAAPLGSRSIHGATG